MIISRTPVRVSFLGGGTDYPSWFLKHGGIVVGGALNKFSFISARYLPPFHTYKTRVVYSDIETVNSNNAIEHRAIRACLQHLKLDGPTSPGFEIFHAADLPGRSGTGSSSTFVVGLLNALSAMQGRLMLPYELAEAAIHIEQRLMGETVGCQDQMWAAHGGLSVIKFAPNGEMNVYPLALQHSQIEALEAHTMLFFTGVNRTSSDIASSYAPSLAEREREQWAMIRLAEQGVEAIQRGRYDRLGWLVDQSWRIKAGLSDKVSSEHICKLYNTARVCGAFGGKITGAGGGGCMLLVVKPEKRAKIITHLEGLGAVHIPFRFHLDGSSIIFSERDNIREYRPAR